MCHPSAVKHMEIVKNELTGHMYKHQVKKYANFLIFKR